MLNITDITYSGFAFSGNPLWVDLQGVGNRNIYKVCIGNKQIFEGRFSVANARIDISGIVDPAIPRLPWRENIPGGVANVLNWQTLDDKYRAIVSVYNNEGDEGSDNPTAYVLPGGVSKYHYIHHGDTDIFDARFLRPGNIFFTTRCTGNKIIIPETELAPLYFLNNSSSGRTLTIKTPQCEIQRSDSLDEFGLWALSPAAIRAWYWEEEKVIPSILEVYINNKYCTTIYIEKAPAAKQRYRLRFRNSFGVFEVVELTGAVNCNLFEDFDSETSGEYRVFDKATGDFVNRRDRLPLHTSFTINSGVKRLDQLRFLLDAICSEEVYLCDLTPEPIRVIPSCEQFSLPNRFRAPQSLDIVLTPESDDKYIMQQSLYYSDRSKFTNTFENKFF